MLDSIPMLKEKNNKSLFVSRKNVRPNSSINVKRFSLPQKELSIRLTSSRVGVVGMIPANTDCPIHLLPRTFYTLISNLIVQHCCIRRRCTCTRKRCKRWSTRSLRRRRTNSSPGRPHRRPIATSARVSSGVSHDRGCGVPNAVSSATKSARTC